jgi:phenylalanyl-tRNA synthetase beta chain
MKISLKWLARHVDLDGLTPERIHDDLTLSTAEVEGLETYGDGLDDLVVGKVVECGKHPEADKLSITKVDVGDGELRQIVCGAPNVRQGLEVAVILPGGRLPGESKKLGKAKLRGVESIGMICSERELKLSDAHEGILELHTGAVPGTKLQDALDVRDHVLEIDNKSINHRPDLWGHRGIAREIAAMHGRPLKPLGADLPEELREVVWPTSGRAVPIAVEDVQGCPRYTGVVFEGVHAGRSPDWLRHLLHACGVRSINQLVDITNFVLLDLGQPQHAFDLRHLDEKAGILVRAANAGETLTTLDEIERRLEPSDILITSGGAPVALAGIMGGQGSMVRDDTDTVFLESATFHPSRVRRTSTRLGLRTDSSARFEKSLDPALAATGAARFASLLRALQPEARIAGPLVDPEGFAAPRPRIRLRRARLATKLGVDLEDARVRGILESLEFEVADASDGFDVVVPSFRATKDVAIEDDLIEEVGRMVRYDNIPGRPLTGEVRVPHREPELWLARRAKTLCAFELCAHECYDYTFTHDNLLAACRVEELPHVRVKNPVAPETARIRRHVLPSLLGHVRHNLQPGVLPATDSELRLFELGKGYWPETKDADGLPAERFELALLAARADGQSPYRALRSDLERVLERLGFPVAITASIDDETARTLPFVHPLRTAAIHRGETVCGFVGMLHPQTADALELPLEGVAVATIDLRALLTTGRQDAQYDRISPYPEQPVDVALNVPAATQVAAVEALLRDCGKKLVRRIELFEVYRGEQVGSDRKSLNFTVTLGAMDRTLSAKDEESYLAAVRQRAGEVGGELRG